VVTIVIKLVSPFTKSPSQGAETTVLCAIHPDANAIGGRYFSRCQPARSSREANDPVVGKRLWS
jgi:hypothetical protein